MRAKPKRLEPYPLADWQTQAEEALRAVAPDLAGWPLYLVPRSTFAGTKMETLCGVECGSTHTAYDLVLKPLLQLMGWWRGRGVTAIIDDTKLGKYFSSHGFAGACLGVAAHEVAHGLVDGWGTAELFDDELARDELAP
ncbi:MAG TPA: hypothetical protein VGX76_09840, partial [Pirellulales bacterium]|nr:hypothetical protein [Pirellulales bacterium]